MAGRICQYFFFLIFVLSLLSLFRFFSCDLLFIISFSFRISKAGDLIEQHNEYTNTSRRLRQTQLESQFQDVQNESIDLAVQNFSLATDLYLDSQRQWKKQRQE